ncbi:MAG TPA: hypothetical protein VMB79_13725 [Jatrophihabitans sp.]|nr:hypothetical protein [Jatrophihabitans sp.]
MRRILAILAGCSLLAVLLAAPRASAAPSCPRPGVCYSAGSFVPVNGNPVRVLDTRAGGGAVAPGHTVTAPIRSAGQGNQALIEVTVPGNAPNGSLSVYPSDTAWTGRVTMTLVRGGPIQQQLTVRLGADGGVTVRNNSAASVHLIVDVLGFYLAGTPTEAGTFAALDSRILDTRAGSPLAAGHMLTLSLPGHGGIPAGGASAVVLNIAVLSARADGLLGITDGDGSQATLHMRFVGSPTAPQTMQTERVVKLSSDGRLTIGQSSAGSVQLVIDLMGYFLPGTDLADGAYVAVSPQPIDRARGQLRLYQHRPVTEYPPVPAFETLAYNLVLSDDRPGEPAMLGMYDPESPWNGSVTVSSTPAGQTTELAVHAGTEDSVSLANLTAAQWTLLHGYLTGYYWMFHCVAC